MKWNSKNSAKTQLNLFQFLQFNLRMTYTVTVFNPFSTDWLQNVSRLDLFIDSSRWYRVTTSKFLFLFFEVPLTENYHFAAQSCGVGTQKLRLLHF
jgi:hypothetical protein